MADLLWKISFPGGGGLIVSEEGNGYQTFGHAFIKKPASCYLPHTVKELIGLPSSRLTVLVLNVGYRTNLTLSCVLIL